MVLLKQLDIRVIGVRPDGSNRKERYGLFECPSCNKQVEQLKSSGLKAKTCNDKKCMHEQKQATLTTHNYSNHSMYNSWSGMKQRCTNKNLKSYKYYGGRGITYDEKWETFEGFSIDMLDTYITSLSLDRKDPEGNYNKSNCQWVSKSENSSKDKLKAVIKCDMNGKHLETYPSAKAAAEVEGYTNQHGITRCARGERKRYLNHIWKWV